MPASASYRSAGMRVHAIRVVASAALIAAATLTIAALKPHAPVISLGALYIIVVLAAAVLWGLPYAVGVSIVSLLAFNWFFLPPVHTFALDDASNWTALLVYLVTAVVTSELAARMRRRAAEAERRERDAALLADLAARLLERGDLSEFTARVEHSTEPAAARLEQAVASLLEIARERERLEQETLETEALRRTDAVKTSVIQSVSHDLRTPLATIEAALDGLETPTIRLDDIQQGELLESVRHELERLKRYVENLLDLSRLQAAAVSAGAGDLDGRCAGGASAGRPAERRPSAGRFPRRSAADPDRCSPASAGARERARERAQVLAAGLARAAAGRVARRRRRVPC